MTPEPKLKIIPERIPYRPTLTSTERRAYVAANIIMREDLSVSNLACPGTRRSRAVDRIAEIIMENMTR